MDYGMENIPCSLREFISDGTPAWVSERYASLRDRATQNQFGLLENVVVIDTETTGISFAKEELTQIAAARMEAGKIV